MWRSLPPCQFRLASTICVARWGWMFALVGPTAGGFDEKISRRTGGRGVVRL
jgi:hypothetical protein